MKKRNQALVVIFSILTLGIYELYWMYVVSRDIESVSDPQGGPCSNGVAAVLLTIVTGGIYQLYWLYELGVRTTAVLGRNNSESGLCYMLLALFGLGVVSQVLLQSDVNTVVDRSTRIEPLNVESAATVSNNGEGTAYADRPQKDRPVDIAPDDGFHY